jgi:hypothetical protein
VPGCGAKEDPAALNAGSSSSQDLCPRREVLPKRDGETTADTAAYGLVQNQKGREISAHAFAAANAACYSQVHVHPRGRWS